MSPLILIFPLMLPISEPHAEPIGMTLATGLPRLVTIMPSGPRWSSNARHCSLNLEAFTRCITFRIANAFHSSGVFFMVAPGASESETALPVIRRAPRLKVKYRKPHWMKTSTRLWNSTRYMR